MAIKKRIGSRRMVKAGTAEMTTGGLKAKDLMYNPHGDIVSVKKSKLAKKQKHLGAYKQKKGSGVFGPAA